MSNFLKPLAALLISILLFAGLVFLADGNLLKFVETRFYNPSIINTYIKENATDSKIVQNHINNLKSKFYQTLTVPAVRSSFLYSQSPNDIFERSKIYGILMESTAGLQSVQFVDSNGIRIHYSTSARDIMSQDQRSTAYRNYSENPTSLPYEIVSVEDANSAKLTMDDQNDRIIFSFPFRDSMDVFRGTALFSVSVRTFAERLIEAGRLKISDNVSLVNDPSGIILGSPETSKNAIFSKVAEIWKEGIQGYVNLDAEDSGATFSLISIKTDQNLFFGRLVNSYLFSLSEPMRLILNVSIFLTFFLTFFFLINLKPNPAAVVRSRIRRLRESFFEQLEDNKTVQEKAKLILELEQRRGEIYSQLKRGLGLKRRLEAHINSIISKSWDEMLVYLKVSSGHDFVAVQHGKKAEVKKQKPAEEVDVIDEVEPLEAEVVDKITEAEPVEEIGEVEDVEEAKPAEEFETIEEAEPAEEAEAVEEIEEIEEVESIEPIKEIKPQKKAKKTNIIDVALDAALETEESGGKGLLGRASKAGKKKSASSAGKKSLLEKASKKSSSKSTKSSKSAPKGKGLLAHAGELEKPVSKKGKGGLLAHASELEKPVSNRPTKGLLSYANEIEVVNDDGEEVEEIAIDVVSPFSSMFSSLKKDE